MSETGISAYHQVTMDEWAEMKHQLEADLLNVQQAFVRIGYSLRKIEEGKLYKQDGYQSVTEFAEAEYNLSASSVSRFMAINKKYSIDGYSKMLRPELAGMGSSKLSEMLALPDSDLEMVRPEMQRSDIRALKEFNRQQDIMPEPEELTKEDVNAEERAKTYDSLIEAFYRDTEGVLKKVALTIPQGFAFSGFMPDSIPELKEIVNPSGSHCFVQGLLFMTMYADKIMIKKMGGKPESMTWEWFFDRTAKIFGEALTDGSNAYYQHFQKVEEEEKKNEPKDDKTTEHKSIPNGGKRSGGSENRDADGRKHDLSGHGESDGAEKQSGLDTGGDGENADDDVQDDPLAEVEDEEDPEEADEEGEEVRPSKQPAESAPGTDSEVEEQEVIKMSRYHYLQKQSTGVRGTATQIAEEVAKHQTVADMANAAFWVFWLNQMVDEEGKY